MTPAASVVLHPAYAIGDIAPEVFGSFVEHLGRGVYGGIFEPDHPESDTEGFRTDVVKLVEELGVTTVRYPGGNFVSAYDWRDGVGPRQQRPVRLDPAWHSVESNAFGVDEFARWARTAGVEPMMAINLGTGDVRSALHLLEYLNHPGGTTLSEERRANGSAEPYGIRWWCLGNEMDGPWQIGRKSAREYGRLAAAAGAAMRAIDPTIKLVVCGSSNDRMPTFGSWERDVLTETIDVADFISCHQYFRNDGDLADFLASGVAMDAFIDNITATIRHVKAVARSTRDVAISFDEWNVWDWQAHDEQAPTLEWQQAPPLLEQRYTVADAVVVGDMLISFLNHADSVRAASLAQLVNVIGPIMTSPSDSAWRQTIFYPFAETRRSAGMTALQASTTSIMSLTSTGPVPALSCAAAHDAETGELHLYLVNRQPADRLPTEIDLTAFPPLTVTSCTVLHDDDPYASNDSGRSPRIQPYPIDYHVDGSTIWLDLPPASWTALRFRPATDQD